MALTIVMAAAAVTFVATNYLVFNTALLPSANLSICVKLPRGLGVRLERFQVMAIVWERHKMLPAGLR